MKVFVAGATGAIGEALVGKLIERGHEVSGGTRRPEVARGRVPDRTWAAFDVDEQEGMVQALRGHEVLVYLVHQMDGGGDLVEREAASGARVARAAAEAGIQHGVFLGSVQPRDGTEPSEHILARARTGQALRSGPVPMVELQASMVIAAQSESWLIVRDLALRLPVMVLPSWLGRCTRPVGLADVLAALVHAVETPTAVDVVEDLPGPELLSVREVLTRTARQRGRRPLMLSVPVLTPTLSSKWIHGVTRADADIADHLVQGMLCDVSGRWPGYWARMPEHTVTTFEAATRDALDASPPPSTRRERCLEWLAGRLSLPA